MSGVPQSRGPQRPPDALLLGATRETDLQDWLVLAARVPESALRPRVYVEACHQPPAVFGPWAAEAVRLAGGIPFLTPPGSSSLDVSWEELMEFDPHLVVLSLRGLGLGFAPEVWMEMEGWNRVEAARTGRIYSAAEGPFGGPGPGLIEGGRLVQGLIGEAFWGWAEGEDPRVRRLKKSSP